jgi:hypothetical protein
MSGLQQASYNQGNPDFHIVITLGEIIGQFYIDLDDPVFNNVQEQFTSDTVGYLTRGLIHSSLRIPGGLKLNECVQFFPSHAQRAGREVLDNVWKALQSEIARAELIIETAHPHRKFAICTFPAPMIDGYYTLTLWYRWLSYEEVVASNYEELSEELENSGIALPAIQALGF